MEKECKNDNNNECKYYLRKRKFIQHSTSLGIKRRENKKVNEKQNEKEKKIKINNDENCKRTKFNLSKIDLNSKIIHKHDLQRLILSLIRNVNNKKNKNDNEKEEENYLFQEEQKKKLIKLLREKIINLSLAQIKKISQKFFPKINNNSDNEIYLELNNLDKNNFDSLFSYVNQLTENNLLNKEFISYQEEINKYNLKKKADFTNYKSIFTKENLINFSNDSSSDESDSFSYNSSNN